MAVLGGVRDAPLRPQTVGRMVTERCINAQYLNLILLNLSKGSVSQVHPTCGEVPL